MQTPRFEDVLDEILGRDPRYARDAYFFVREALDFTQKLALRSGREQVRHVTGQELLAGIREFALKQYGPMAALLFHEWGLARCEDFGEIVFNMVEASLLAKTKKDSREDFKGGYDFDDAFRRPFLPKIRNVLPPARPVRSGNA